MLLLNENRLSTFSQCWTQDSGQTYLKISEKQSKIDRKHPFYKQQAIKEPKKQIKILKQVQILIFFIFRLPDPFPC